MSLKIKFNPNLDFQNDAVKAVIDLFKGQEKSYSNFTIYDPKKYIEDYKFSIGYNNQLLLTEDEILKNLQNVQKDNRLKTSNEINFNKNLNFAVEMETGTGKTYVYIKTIMNLHKQYNFKKYIILVPSVAIRENVIASLKVLKEHFKLHYDGEEYRHFKYDSSETGELLKFANSNNIEIMVMTIQSLDSDNKVLHSEDPKHLEKTNGIKPINIINRINPILIIDEPQKTSSSENRKKYISELNPLFSLQYSATHKKEKNIHKIYRLTSIDAYLKKLVKQIEVASIVKKNDNNMAYIKLINVISTKNTIKAKIEIDYRDKNFMVKRKKIDIKKEDDLYTKSGKRDIYDGIIISKISNSPEKYIELNNKNKIYINNCINDYDIDTLKRIQIRKTIEEHFEKEKILNPLGIKVLSLFFIDEVKNYRSWDKENNIINGKYFEWFEEEYNKIRKNYEKYDEIKSINHDVSKIHHGYFAEDNKHRFKNTQGSSEDDIKAYESILKNKEDLLSFNNKIRFIFSHSALREGWDNPNVFQICTLNEKSKNIDSKRQEIGRGLRLCVNQYGERLYGFDINRLTIMANQSYDEFAKQLQKEIQDEEGFKFGYISDMSFSHLYNNKRELGEDLSKSIYEELLKKEYINDNGYITEKLKIDIENKSNEILEEFYDFEYEIVDYLRKVCSDINISNKENEITNNRNEQIYNNSIFENLWNNLKVKVKYDIEYNDENIINECSKELKKMNISNPNYIYHKARIKPNTNGISTDLINNPEEIESSNKYYNLPDILTDLQNSTSLTRKIIFEILKKSETIYMFAKNPNLYFSEVSNIINQKMNYLAQNNIKYKKIGKDEFLKEEVFNKFNSKKDSQKLIKSSKSIYEYNEIDSNPEKRLAEYFEKNDDIIFYTKLPVEKYYIPTPIGKYTPDWVIVTKENENFNLYLIVENKGSNEEEAGRKKEVAKINFGKQRFKDLNDFGYIVTKDEQNFMQKYLEYKRYKIN